MQYLLFMCKQEGDLFVNTDWSSASFPFFLLLLRVVQQTGLIAEMIGLGCG